MRFEGIIETNPRKRTTYMMRRRRRKAEQKERLAQPDIDTRADLAIHILKNNLPKNRRALEIMARDCYFKSTPLTALAVPNDNGALQILAALDLSHEDYGKVGAFLSEEARLMKKEIRKKS